MIYCIQARVTKHHGEGWKANVGVATFFLDGDIQGIINAVHAEEIARRILNPFDDPTVEVHAFGSPAELLTKA